MPWQGMSLMALRRHFIEDWQTQALTMTALCAQYGVSRKTGYQLVARWEREGEVAWSPRSRRPHTFAQATPPAVVAAVEAARRQHPRWGARKLRGWLRLQQPAVAWPSRGTCHTICVRAGLVRPARRSGRPTRRVITSLRPATQPNATWTIDFKGDFRLGDGSRCYPLTLRDLASRFTLSCCAFAQPDLGRTQRQVERVFAEFGLPDCIRSDNGPPFAGPGLAGLSQLNVTWLRLGIVLEHIAPGRPDQNGAHEQFHGVLKAATARPPAHTSRGQQRRFDRFVEEYNTERPHEALGDEVPAQHYVPSRRPWPRRLPPLEYPGHWEVRRVGSNGSVHLRSTRIFISRALDGHDVGFEEIADGVWTLHFGPVQLARWYDGESAVRSLTVD